MHKMFVRKSGKINAAPEKLHSEIAQVEVWLLSPLNPAVAGVFRHPRFAGTNEERMAA